jgi:hypothetical protein
MSSKPPIGAIAFGKSGIGCSVIEIAPECITLLHPEGKTLKVLSKAIIRWETSIRTPPQTGDRIRVKNTSLFYTLIEVFEMPYWINGDRTVELWARCEGIDGQIVKWKLCQLQVQVQTQSMA